MDEIDMLNTYYDTKYFEKKLRIYMHIRYT